MTALAALAALTTLLAALRTPPPPLQRGHRRRRRRAPTAPRPRPATLHRTLSCLPLRTPPPHPPPPLHRTAVSAVAQLATLVGR
eukprot:246235-Prymnesium_polylepis.1